MWQVMTLQQDVGQASERWERFPSTLFCHDYWRHPQPVTIEKQMAN
eukprot:SAG31_NODE_21373_length_551_cov_1.099558_2_plen_45_part_01